VENDGSSFSMEKTNGMDVDKERTSTGTVSKSIRVRKRG
jgi:hypothetical protein